MKRSIVLLSALLAIALTGAAQRPYLTVTECTEVILPAEVQSMSFCDGRLYIRIPQVMLSAINVNGHLQGIEGDLTTRELGSDVHYIVRHPVTGHRYYSNRKGCLYEEVPRPEKKPAFVRVKLPHFSGSIVNPVFSPDGKWMVFSSNARGGAGGTDLWATSSDTACRWLMPIRLGSTVNTAGNETSPALTDGYLLYSSQVAADSSPMALYSSPIAFIDPNDTLPQGAVVVGPAQQLPPPINAGGSNHSLVVAADGSRGYWLSDREGEERLYTFQGSLRCSRVWGTLYDEEHQPMEGVQITLRSQGRTVDTATTLADGSYTLFLEAEQPYTIYYSLRDHFTEEQRVQISAHGDNRQMLDLRKDITLSRLQYDTTVYMMNIFGEEAEEELSANGLNQLEPLVRFMRQNPHVAAAISLRTDLTKDAAYNRLLNQHRIETLRNYITSQVAQPNMAIYNDCDYDGGCSTGSVNSILAVILRIPKQK